MGIEPSADSPGKQGVGVGGDAHSDAPGSLSALLASLTPGQRAELARLLTPPPNTS